MPLFLVGLWSKVWPYVAIAGAVALALLGIYSAVRKSGRDAERADEMKAGLDAIRRANQAAAKVDPSKEAIDNDPNNLDRAGR